MDATPLPGMGAVVSDIEDATGSAFSPMLIGSILDLKARTRDTIRPSL
jgi:hypothetical protein